MDAAATGSAPSQGRLPLANTPSTSGARQPATRCVKPANTPQTTTTAKFRGRQSVRPSAPSAQSSRLGTLAIQDAVLSRPAGQRRWSGPRILRPPETTRWDPRTGSRSWEPLPVSHSSAGSQPLCTADSFSRTALSRNGQCTRGLLDDHHAESCPSWRSWLPTCEVHRPPNRAFQRAFSLPASLRRKWLRSLRDGPNLSDHDPSDNTVEFRVRRSQSARISTLSGPPSIACHRPGRNPQKRQRRPEGRLLQTTTPIEE